MTWIMIGVGRYDSSSRSSTFMKKSISVKNLAVFMRPEDSGYFSLKNLYQHQTPSRIRELFMGELIDR